ncbi:TonB-dependent receptor [Thermodesulfobacterium sp. TA1]|uniref:TonB-dependent receptor plug domain-containing protein n=1 Tax=Thermodesulfobacterium sp. TA1 TaxID=2234087 RepID=UPI001232DA4E|nr:TonB-dependent receptor [Thermodesulfobacterium sp. TA1]QER42561.1 TonB-dependent receptor [Thermodesulfobacterium sp. TA1]
MGKNLLNQLSFFLMAGILASPGFCTEKPKPEEFKELPEVVVSADRVEEPIKETTAKVTVITKEELKKKNFVLVTDVLRTLPQVYVRANGGPGQTAGAILSRGAKSYHTLVLIDGFKVNDPSLGMFDFGSLTVDDIERIEIVEGPQSTLYGSEAVAGVINIITKKGKGKPKVGISLDAGSYGTYKPSFEVAGEFKGFDFRLNAFHYYTDGFSASRYGSEKDGFKNSFVSTKMGVNFHPKARFEVLGRYSYGRTEYDGYDFRYNLIDKDYVRREHHYLIGAKLDLSLLHNYKQTFSVYKNRFQRKFYEPDGWFPYNRYTPSAEGFSWENFLSLGKAYSLVFGVDFKREKVEMLSESSLGLTSYDEKREHVGIFVNNKFSFLEERLIFNVGLRHDDYKNFGEKTTYRLGFRYIIPQIEVVLKANYGTSFRAPTFDDLFYPNYSNPNLNPEESKGWDLSLERVFFKERLLLGISAFYQKYKDLIQFDQTTWKPENIGKAVIKGAEAYLNLRLTQNLSFKANYTYLDAEDRDKGKYLVYKPSHKAGATLEYSWKNLTLLADYVYTGERFHDKDNTKSLKPYSLVNLSANYSFNPKLKFYFRIENLFNANYEEVKDYGTPDRSIYGGIKFDY